MDLTNVIDRLPSLAGEFDAFQALLAVCGAIVVAVYVAMFHSFLAHRRRAIRDRRSPGHHGAREIIWALIPFGIVLATMVHAFDYAVAAHAPQPSKSADRPALSRPAG